MDGWICLHRQLTDHWIYQDAEYLKAWLEMLLRARCFQDPSSEYIDGQLITVQYGEFIFGRVQWSKRLKIGEQRLRTLIKKLKQEEMISISGEYRKCTLYRIKNFEKYQNFNHQANREIIQAYQEVSASLNHEYNQQLTISQPSPNQQLTTNKQLNNYNNINNYHHDNSAKNIFGMYEQEIGALSPTITELLIDHEEFYGEEWVKRAITVAVKSGKKNLSYIEGTLRAWKKLEHPEPWTIERQPVVENRYRDKVRNFPRDRQQNTRGKPVIPVMQDKPGERRQASEEEVERILKKAAKWEA